MYSVQIFKNFDTGNLWICDLVKFKFHFTVSVLVYKHTGICIFTNYMLPDSKKIKVMKES